MEKRTIKDFVALYAPEDEEKLVLIQSGVSADKTFLDTFWTAHTQALAMADVQTGQVIFGRCYLSWPLTEFSVSPGGRFTAWYEDDDMFWGHVVTVDGTLKKGPVGADMQG